MRIRVWNAFASNNSGSYTIVGRFDSEALAAEIASELAELMSAHTAWLEVERRKNKYPLEGESPLEAFVKRHDLTWEAKLGTDDDWPEYGGNNVPQAFAIGPKVIIHHDYTVTMPRVFGEYFYARGGRVENEMNHAHHPIVGLVDLWIPRQEREGVDVAAKVSAVVEALNAADGPLVSEVPPWHEPAWQTKGGFGEPDLTLGAVFTDLFAGFTAVQRVAAAHGLQAWIRLFEAHDARDALSFLRPSRPQLRARLCDVVLDGRGTRAKDLSAAIATLLHHDHAAANELLAAPVPVTVRSGLVLARAEKIAALLRDAGASVSIVVGPRKEG